MLRKLNYLMLLALVLMMSGCIISGTVTNEDEEGIKDVNIFFGAGGSATTDENGNYWSSDILPLQYTVIPSKEGYTFLPPSRTVTIADFISLGTTNVDFVASISSVDTFDLQAHRGGMRIPPGNILPAFEYALDLEVSTLELDTHITKDGEIVVIHDISVLKDAFTPISEDTAPIRLSISRMTLNEIRQYRCALTEDIYDLPGRTSDTLIADDQYAHVPTLKEVFEFCTAYASSPYKTNSQRQNADQIRFNIEAKTPGYEPTLISLIEDFGVVDRVMIQSFLHFSINRVSNLNPSIETSALTFSNPYANPTWIAWITDAAVWSPDYEELTEEMVSCAHHAGLRVIPYTVNTAHEMETLLDMGVDGIITNYPDILKVILDENGIIY